MQSHEVRKRFLDFFVERGHKLYPSSSLVPHNDPTVLLTTAGMQQFITYFTGQERPPTPRGTSVQKCFRTVDLEEVGDSTTPHVLRDARQLLLRRLLQEGGHRVGLGVPDRGAKASPRAALDHDLRGQRGRARGPRSEGALDALRRPRGAHLRSPQERELVGSARRHRPLRPVLGGLLRLRRGPLQGRPQQTPSTALAAKRGIRASSRSGTSSSTSTSSTRTAPSRPWPVPASTPAWASNAPLPSSRTSAPSTRPTCTLRSSSASDR